MLVLAKALSLSQTKHLLAQVATARGSVTAIQKKPYAMGKNKEQRMRPAAILTQILPSRNGSVVTVWR